VTGCIILQGNHFSKKWYGFWRSKVHSHKIAYLSFNSRQNSLTIIIKKCFIQNRLSPLILYKLYVHDLLGAKEFCRSGLYTLGTITNVKEAFSLYVFLREQLMPLFKLTILYCAYLRVSVLGSSEWCRDAIM